MTSRLVCGLLLVVALSSSTGCHLMPNVRMPWAPQAPVVFTAPPTADDIVRAVNSNSAPVRQLATDSASVSAAGFPPLRADLAFERPRNFRMRASLLGPELDVGSNDDLFWMWVKHSPQPGVFYARHDRFATSPARQLMPIDPALVVDSFGLMQLDPLGAFDAPRDLGDHKLEIRTRVPSPDGDLTRVIVVHDKYGWVLEQRLFDSRNRLIATAVASQHRHYPEVGVSLPHRLEFKLPAAQLDFTVNVNTFRINQLDGSAQLWTLPQMEGYPLVDITDPRFMPQVSPASAPAPQGMGAGGSTGTMPAGGPAGTGNSAPIGSGVPTTAIPTPGVYRTSEAPYKPRYRGFW
ncbi:MAG: hypothetical protein U1A77_09960 [Pirellulales bacterium]